MSAPERRIHRAFDKWRDGDTPNELLCERVIAAADKEIAEAIATERARADAWKTLHDAKGHGPYNYASQERRREIRDALAIVNGETSS